jgi:hypothetical protein
LLQADVGLVCGSSLFAYCSRHDSTN